MRNWNHERFVQALGYCSILCLYLYESTCYPHSLAKLFTINLGLQNQLCMANVMILFMLLAYFIRTIMQGPSKRACKTCSISPDTPEINEILAFARASLAPFPIPPQMKACTSIFTKRETRAPWPLPSTSSAYFF